MKAQPLAKTIPVALTGGLTASLRPVLPADAPLLEEGFAGLSDSSRHARFGTGIGHLTSHELRYLTDVDLVTHVAWGATIDDEAAGIGRYVVIPDQACAEVAITVVDRFQRRGLGRHLFEALTAVARFDDLSSFCFEVAPSNAPVRRLLRGVAGENAEGDLLHGQVPLSDIPPGTRDQEFVGLMEYYRSIRQISSPQVPGQPS